MPLSLRLTRRVFVLWMVCVLAAPTAAAQPPADRFLVIADFHFDPFDGLNREQFQMLAAAPADEWPRLLASQPPAAYGRDSPYALLQSSFDDARTQIPDPAFILFPGDFMAHEWQAKYDRLAAKTRADDRAAYWSFTTKALQLIAQRVRHAFPKTPFLPVLGNDDSYCGDYMIGPDSPFLAMFAQMWEPLLHFPPADGELQQFRESCSRGGYYTLRLPQLQKHRLVALNTVFFSTQYSNACGDAVATPALDHFQWLETTLAAAREADERVWLLMHIPPGIDGYSTNRANGSPVSFWQPELTAKFLQLLQRYESTIRMAFAGHTHMDDFRIIRLNDTPILLTKITPAVSPTFYNNPGYQIFDYAPDTGVIWNYRTRYLPLVTEAKSAQAKATEGKGAEEKPDTAAIRGFRRNPPTWQHEYDFRAIYDLTPVTAGNVSRLANQLTQGGPAQKAYLTYYSVTGPPARIPIDVLSRAILNTTPAEFDAADRGMPAAKE